MNRSPLELSISMLAGLSLMLSACSGSDSETQPGDHQPAENAREDQSGAADNAAPSEISATPAASATNEQSAASEASDAGEATASETAQQSDADAQTGEEAALSSDSDGQSESSAVTPAQSDASSPAPAPIWVVDYENSRLEFTGTQSGNEFTGSFSNFEASIQMEPENLQTASIEVAIVMASAQTGDRQRDDSLPAAEWFNVETFPRASFTSDDISKVGENSYEAFGTLTIREIAKPVTLPFTLVIDGEAAAAEGGLTIMRNGFDVGTGEWASGQWVGLDVAINFALTATRQQ